MARLRFPELLPKKGKSNRGRTGVGTTRVAIGGVVELDDPLREEIADRLTRKLSKLATHISLISVRFEDVDGPRSGVGIVCKVQVALDGLPSVVVTETARDPQTAFRRAAPVVQRAAQRAIARAGRSTKPARSGPEPAEPARSRRAPARSDEGSLIGRRVGRANSNLERALERPEKTRRDHGVDTAQRGMSASDRRAGYGASAARNTKRNTAGMTATLEDSRKKPSRKSTRRSANRAKSGTALELRNATELQSAKARATRAGARKAAAQKPQPRSARARPKRR